VTSWIFRFWFLRSAIFATSSVGQLKPENKEGIAVGITLICDLQAQMRVLSA